MRKYKRLIKETSALFCFLFIGAILIIYRTSVSDGIKNGLAISGEILIPSLFPFLVFSVLSSRWGFSDRVSRIFSFVTEKIFRLPCNCFSVILFGFIGGYPVGMRLCRELYEEKSVTVTDCRHLMAFCVNAGPSFIVTAVGEGILGSRKAGFVLLSALTLSSLVTGVVYGIFKERCSVDKISVSDKKDFSETLIYSVSSATESILSICAWVLLFSAFISVIDVTGINEKLKLVIYSLAEVTTGIKSAAQLGGLPYVAFCMSFGSLSIMFQLLPSIKKCGIKVKSYLFFRIVNSAFSYFFVKLILCFVDISGEVFSYTAEIFSFNAPASAALLIMCALFVFQLRREKSSGF